MDDGAGVRQSGRLDDHVVEALQLAEEFFETLDEIATDATAQTAVVQFENLLIDADHELVVDADGTEFVDDDGALVAVILGKQMVEQGRLARAQESRQHRHGNGFFLRHAAMVSETAALSLEESEWGAPTH